MPGLCSDPLANSFVAPLTADMADDSRLSVEDFERSPSDDEEYGIDHLKLHEDPGQKVPSRRPPPFLPDTPSLSASWLACDYPSVGPEREAADTPCAVVVCVPPIIAVARRHPKKALKRALPC